METWPWRRGRLLASGPSSIIIEIVVITGTWIIGQLVARRWQDKWVTQQESRPASKTSWTAKSRPIQAMRRRRRDDGDETTVARRRWRDDGNKTATAMKKKKSSWHSHFYSIHLYLCPFFSYLCCIVVVFILCCGCFVYFNVGCKNLIFDAHPGARHFWRAFASTIGNWRENSKISFFHYLRSLRDSLT